jgi:acetone carboxylase gamma subunit
VIRISESLGVREVQGKMVYECLKCGEILGSAKEDYKNFALKRTVPISKAQPEYLASYSIKSDTFVMREYYCPKCAVMFEVDMTAKNEPHIHSIKLELKV